MSSEFSKHPELVSLADEITSKTPSLNGDGNGDNTFQSVTAGSLISESTGGNDQRRESFRSSFPLGIGGANSVDNQEPSRRGDFDIMYNRACDLHMAGRKTNGTAEFNDAIESYRLALESVPRDYSDRADVLDNLALCLSDRYDRTGGPDDLSDAIQLGQESLDLRPPGHPDRPASLANLATYLSKRYHKAGDFNNLPEAIRLTQQSLNLRPPGHPDRSASLVNLATYLSERYDKAGDLGDLSEAIQLGQQSLDLAPLGHPFHSSSLSNLATYLDKRYDKTGDLNDLSEAIQLGQQSLGLRPPGHPLRSASLHNLATYLNKRYNEAGDPNDLSDAIRLGQQSLDLCPPRHPLRSSSLHNLATYLNKRYNKTGNLNDLSEAIQLGQQSLVLRPPGHPKRPNSLVQVALYLSRQVDTIEPQDRDTAVDNIIAMVKEATLPSVAIIPDRIAAAYQWRYLAEKYGHSSQLEAARETLNLLDLAVAESTTLDGLSGRFSDDRRFSSAQGVASDASALAIQSGDVTLAVSLLEQGRSSIFNQLGRYRSTIDEIREASEELATRFTTFSSELDSLVLNAGAVSTEDGNPSEYTFRDKAARHGHVYGEWTKTVEDIRRLPGLNSFLLPPPFHHLQRSAECGPIILVNLNERRSDAIIVISTGEPHLVPLPDAYPEVIQRFIDRLGKRQAECDTDVAIEILREIWRVIVAPIVQKLRGAAIDLAVMSRIWWCPVGAASRLPLHAAGPYKRGERNLPNIFVSSYTPTLGALIRGRESKVAGSPRLKPAKRILLVGQSDTPQEKPLPNVVDEIQAIQALAPDALSLQSSDATREAVLKGIQECNWLHMACHGHHHPKQPFRSHFSMHNGPISLLDLISKDIPQAELAVLSACHSARVSEVLPDESLHPAAGMLFAGFKSVIGTMWAFDDGLGSPLAGEFYKRMLDGKKDYTDAAVVLGRAFREVMKKDPTAVSFMQYINVVHYGV